MTGPEFPPFSAAREGWTIQLQDNEGGWHSEATLLADPAPCKCLCGGMSAPSELLSSGARLPQHAKADHLMRVLSRASETPEDIDRARQELAARVEHRQLLEELHRELDDE